MAEEMRADDRIFVMGEEVAEYQGAYKVTQGLLEQFEQRGFAGAVGQLREPQRFARLTDATSFESGNPRLSGSQARACIRDFSLCVGEHAVAACRSALHSEIGRASCRERVCQYV